MNLPDVLDAWRLYVDQAISDVAGPGAPAQSIIYHTHLPDDCCDDDGVLGVWWETADFGVSGLTPLRLSSVGQWPGGYQIINLGARYHRCWYVPPVEEIGSKATYARYNGDAALMALITDHVNLQLIRLTCGAAKLGDGLFCQGARWTTARPDLSGDCAGIEWHLVAGLAGDTDIS